MTKLESVARALESDATAQNWFATGAGFGLVLGRYDVDGLGWALVLGAGTALTSMGLFALRRLFARATSQTDGGTD